MVDHEDHFKQEKVYTKNGKGRWVVIGYCDSPSLTMKDVDSGDELNFGLAGQVNKDFIEIPGLSSREVQDEGRPNTSDLPMSRSMLKIKDLEGAIADIKGKMKFRLKQKGGRTYASVHEAYGIIAGEHKELLDAIHGNEGHDAIVEELNDIAVACVIAIASIKSGSVHW
ncbi:hypothetical protein KAR91_61115 [Candidatus Pacearchaeota archaeon]|nr:hypothetical protein [Candidatus Pacearchaeota archaeon]